MNIFITTLFCLMATAVCSGQTPDELNEQAKRLLAKPDSKAAFPLLKQAAEGGNAEAQYNYGCCYQYAIEVPKDDSIADIWFLKSARQGWPASQLKIAFSYATGRGIQKDSVKAFEWSVKCALQAEPECMLNVSDCYEDGRGTAKNMDSAIIWAARLGASEDSSGVRIGRIIAAARIKLAAIYREGKGVKKDLVKSYMWCLLFNENKKIFSVSDQQPYIDSIEELEKDLSKTDKKNAQKKAEKLIGRPLRNVANLHKQEI